MGSPSQLSFLPDDYLERKAQRRTNAVCAVLFLVVAGAVGSVFVLSERRTRTIDAEYSVVDRQYVADAERIQKVKQMAEKQKQISQKADLASSLIERAPRHRVLAEITNATEPLGVHLVDLVLDSKPRNKPAPAEPARTAYEQKKAARQGLQPDKAAQETEIKQFDVLMKLTGVARTDVQVAQYLRALSNSRAFRDVNLLISDEFKSGEDKLRRFQIEMVLAPDVDLRQKDEKARQTATAEIKEQP